MEFMFPDLHELTLLQRKPESVDCKVCYAALLLKHMQRIVEHHMVSILHLYLRLVVFHLNSMIPVRIS